ncbi:hypothetical protein HAX54_010657 [Datura stramonium]|uniref:Uncharacterized protein n=1 Tax=Datura stramonium TaxID=4076 RepID=A0ABS8THI9_DATST|nr:hypothetical protein [Datura stramonium]
MEVSKETWVFSSTDFILPERKQAKAMKKKKKKEIPEKQKIRRSIDKSQHILLQPPRKSELTWQRLLAPDTCFWKNEDWNCIDGLSLDSRPLESGFELTWSCSRILLKLVVLARYSNCTFSLNFLS